MANKSYIELPKFFASNLINDETEYSTIIIEEGLEEVDGKQVGFITAPITFNLNDTFTQERLPGSSGINARGEWNLFTATNRETPVLTKEFSFLSIGLLLHFE